MWGGIKSLIWLCLCLNWSSSIWHSLVCHYVNNDRKRFSRIIMQNWDDMCSASKHCDTIISKQNKRAPLSFISESTFLLPVPFICRSPSLRVLVSSTVLFEWSRSLAWERYVINLWDSCCCNVPAALLGSTLWWIITAIFRTQENQKCPSTSERESWISVYTFRFNNNTPSALLIVLKHQMDTSIRMFCMVVFFMNLVRAK